MGLSKPRGKHAQVTHEEPSKASTAVNEQESPYEGHIEGAPVEAVTLDDVFIGTDDSSTSHADAFILPKLDLRSDEPAASEEDAVPEATPSAIPAEPTPPVTATPQFEAPQVVSAGAPVTTFTGGGPGTLPPEAYVTTLPDGTVLQKKRSVGKVVGITFGIIIGVLLLAYIAGAVVFMNLFFPRTIIAGQDVSMKTNGDVAAMLNNMVDDYTLDVKGDNGYSYHMTGSDVGLSVDTDGVVKAMHADLNAWMWPVLLFGDKHDESDKLTLSYKKSSYEDKVTDTITKYNESATAPVDATISYDETTKKFKVVPEVPGTQYDSRSVIAVMDDAINSLNTDVRLTSDELVQPNVLSTDQRLIDSAELATGLVSAHVTLTMVGKPVAEINGDNLSQFIRMDENMGVTLDEAAIDQWVTDLSNSFDTVGTERTYVRPDGKEITIGGGVYGWITDSVGLKDQIVAAVKAGQTTTIDIPCEQTAAEYNGPGQPDWGGRYIDVDLSEQYVRFYDGGNIIWETACISGTPDGEHNTWPGVWYITNKESPSKLIGYLPNGQKEYETTVQYWMAFEGNGIGLHDATWQPDFGGDMYASGYGSHGCVNISYDAAASLYEISAVGDPVIAHY